VARAVEAVGWSGFVAFALCWLLVIGVLGLAWAAAAPGAGPVRLFLWGRLLREAAADILPFSHVGGLVVGARGVIAGGAPSELVFASVLVDLTAELLGQVFYTLVGLGLLAARLGASQAAPAVLWAGLAGLAAVFAGAVGFLAGQGVAVRWLGRIVVRWLPESADRAEAVATTVTAIYRRRARVALSVALHLAAWIGSSAVSWLALRFMGLDVGLEQVIAVESLMYAVRNVGFALPAGLGVQEAAYVLIGPVFGLHAGDALALSLLKRARDLVIGVPVILAWQLFEGRLLLRQRGKVSPAPGPVE
jgi:putative membrane protein